MASSDDSGLSIGSSLADVLRMRPSFIEKLALCLDRKMRLIPNWKHLSHELNVDAAVISSLEGYSDFSPTIRMFEYLEVTRPDLTIQQLKQALSDIGRNDLFRLITKKAAGCTDSELVKDVITTKDVQSPSPQAGLLDDLALALDRKSKILKNWSGLAEKLGVPRKCFRKFDIQSTIDPTCQLFQYLAVTRPQMTLKTLREALVKMTRNDLITIFRDRNLSDEIVLKDVMKTGSELLQTVADKLNMEQVPGVQSWRQLAHQLGIPHDAYREFDRTEPRKSPTTEILQWLTAQYPDITLIDVVKALDKVQRNDAIQIITEQFPDTVDTSFELPNDPTGEAFFTSRCEEERISNVKEEVSKMVIEGERGHCGSLPDEAYELKGREDVCEQIIKSLVTKKAVEIVAPPGYGKTSVVVKVAHKLISRYGKFIAYVNPRGVKCVEDLAGEIIEALDGIPGENTIRQCLRTVRTLKTDNVVLIIENLDDLLHLEKNQKLESSRPVGEEWCAKMIGKNKKDDFLTFIKELGQTGTINLVLTSTETNDFSVSFPTELIELQPLSDDNSFALFKERDSGLDEDTIKKLVSICGGIPLIICTVLSLLKKRNPQNLARRLSSCSALELIKELSPDFLPPEDRIEHCLQVCFCRLSQENQDVLVKLSTFPHRFIQEQVFTVFQSSTKPDLEKCINSLKHCSLLRFERNSCNYCIHPIIRKFCSTQPQHKQAKSSFVRHYSDLVVSLNERFFTRDSKAVVERYRVERENFKEATAWCEEEQVDLDQELRDHCIDAFNKASVFLAKVMRKQEFESLFCKLSHQCHDDLRRSSCLTAIGTKIVLSCMCTPRICSRARYRAHSVLSRANAIQSGLEKVDEVTRAQCLSKLGFCLVREGRDDDGFEYLNQAVSMREKLYELSKKDEDKVMLAACKNDIAASLMLQRKHLAAIETRRNFVLPVYEKILGKHPFVATTLSWIGKSYHELGLYGNAIKYAKEAINIRETLLGSHQETARSYFDLGDALLAKKQFSRALEPLKRAAEMQEEVLDTYEELILTHQALAVVLKELRRDKEAEREMELAQECAKNVSSLDVPLRSRQKTDPMPIDRK